MSQSQSQSQSHGPSMNVKKNDSRSSNLYLRDKKSLFQEQSNGEEKYDLDTISDGNCRNHSQTEKSFYDTIKNSESNLTVSIPDNDNDLQCLILNMCKVSVSHLPVGVVRLLLNAFRTAAGYAVKDYEAFDEEFDAQHHNQTTHTEGNKCDSTSNDLLFSKIIREEVILEIQAIRNDASWPSGFPTLKREMLPHEMWHFLDLLESPLGKTAGLPDTVILPGPPAFSWPFTSPEKAKVMEAFYAETAMQGKTSEKSSLLCPIDRVDRDRDRVNLTGSRGDLGSLSNNSKIAGSFDVRDERTLYAESVGSEKSFYSCVGDHDVPIKCNTSEDGVAAVVFDRFIVAAFTASYIIAEENTDVCVVGSKDTTHKTRKNVSQRFCPLKGEGFKKKNGIIGCASSKIITTQNPVDVTNQNEEILENKK